MSAGARRPSHVWNNSHRRRRIASPRHTGLFGSFGAIQQAMQQVGNDTVFAFDADHSMTLQNVNMASLQASDFHII